MHIFLHVHILYFRAAHFPLDSLINTNTHTFDQYCWLPAGSVYEAFMNGYFLHTLGKHLSESSDWVLERQSHFFWKVELYPK